MGPLQIVREISKIDNKKTGMPGNLKAQQIIKDYLSKFKGKIIQESYPITVYSENNAAIMTGKTNVKGYLHDYTGFGQKSEINAEIIKVGKIWDLNFLLKNPKGKIIMCKSDLFIHRIIQIKDAIKNGAIALIIVSPFNDEIVYGVGAPYLEEPIKIPVIGITKNQAKNIKNGQVCSIKIGYKPKKTNGKNIIFEFEGAKSPAIVIGAHYDGWSYGAQDNAISLYFMFKLIESLKDDPLRNNYRFIFFDSEELGMVGSYNHLKKYSYNNYEIYVNFDSIIPTKGSYFKAILYSKNSKSVIPLTKCLLNGYLPFSLDFFYKFTKHCFPSDSHYFYLKNIPTLTTFSSGRFYHTKKDTFENLNLKKIKNISNILNRLLSNINNDYRKN